MSSELLLPSSNLAKRNPCSVSFANGNDHNQPSSSPPTQLRTKDQILKSMKAQHRSSFTNGRDGTKIDENNNNNNNNSQQQQQQQENERRRDNFFRPGACACLPPVIRNPLKTFWKFLNKLNYVAVLLTFTACCCLFFAIVLYIDGPMTRLETDLIVTVTSTKFNVSFFHNDTNGNNNNISNNGGNNNASWNVLSQVSVLLTFQNVRNDYAVRPCKPFATIDPAIFDPLSKANEDAFSDFYFLNESLSSPSDIANNKSTTLLPERFTETFVGYNITTITNFTSYEFAVVQRGRLAFREALFVSVSAFTASGLSSVDYSFWTTGPLTTIACTMTFGSTVLLTILPAILRYFALVKERKKLIQILLSTGAYDEDDDDAAVDDVAAADVGNDENNNNNNKMNRDQKSQNVSKPLNLNSLRFTGNDDDDDDNETLASPTAEQISRVGLIFLDGSGDTLRIRYPAEKIGASRNEIDHHADEAKNKTHALLNFFDDDDTNEKETIPTGGKNREQDWNSAHDRFIMSRTSEAANSINYDPAIQPHRKTFSSGSPSDNASFSSANNNNNNSSKSFLQSPLISPSRNSASKLSPATSVDTSNSIKLNTAKSDRKRSNTILGFSPPSPNSQQQQLPSSSPSSSLRSASPKLIQDSNIAVENNNNTISASNVPLISLTNASSDFTNGNQQQSVSNSQNNIPSTILLTVPLSSELTKEDSQDTIPKSLVHSNSGNSSAKHSGTFFPLAPPALTENNNNTSNGHNNNNNIKNNDNDNSATITFGQRIVYEDGLAHVNQQIDICLIIIFGAIFYTLLIHLVSTIIITIWAPSQYWNFGFSLFHVISCFNNAGFAMGQIFEVSGSPIVMIVMIFLMVAGNSLYPIFFRLMLQFLHWMMRKYTTTSGEIQQKTKFIFGQPVHVWQHSLWLFLRYPRRFYTHMFSPRASLVLLGVWSAMTVIGCLLMIPEMYHSDLLSPDVPEAQHYKWLIALYQTVSVRQTGIAIVRMDRLMMGQLAWWVLAMYLAAYPFILTVRSSSGRRTESVNSSAAKNDDDEKADDEEMKKNSNNHNENEARIDADDKSTKRNTTSKSSTSSSSSSSSDDTDVAEEEYAKSKNGGVTTSVVQEEATAVMARDVLWLYLAIVLICYCENQYTVDDTIDHDYSLYLRITFEVISSFANVGLSLNIVGDVPNASYSASLKNVLSPLILIVVMYFGKHRGLPQSVDEAISIHVRKYEFSGDYNPDDEEKEENNTAIGGKRRRSHQLDSADVSMTEFPEHGAENDDKHKAFHAATSSSFTPSTRKTFSVRRREIFKLRIEHFYAHYNPARIPQVERIISAFESNPKALLRNLEATYGPDVNKKAIEREEKKLSRLRKMASERRGVHHHHHQNDDEKPKNRRSNSLVEIPSAQPSRQDPDI